MSNIEYPEVFNPAGAFGLIANNPTPPGGGAAVTLNTVQTITGQKTLTPASLATVGLIIKGVAGQTADLLQWKDSAGTVQAGLIAR